MKSSPKLATIVGTFCGEKGCRLTVEGGLHYIKGNSAPYFTLTATVNTLKGREVAGGCLHDEILKAFPRFADLAAMHLSDIDGAPMHAVENAKYRAGIGEYGKRDRDALQRHLRCADNSVDNLLALADSGDVAQFCGDVEAMRTRWAMEAKACISKHNLAVFGDVQSAMPEAAQFIDAENSAATITALRAEVERLREILRELGGWANLRADDPRWNNLGGRVAAELAKVTA